MKIYFTAALSGVPSSHREHYEHILAILRVLGHRIVGESITGESASKITSGKEDVSLKMHQQMISWKNQADIIVAEASYPCIRVGQEISYALSQNKPVIVLYLKGKKPEVLRALGTEYLHVVEYTPETVESTLHDYIEYAKETADTRFNFFISSEIDAFLDWISKKRKVPRAVFLRELIEEDMKKNGKYLKEIGSK